MCDQQMLRSACAYAQSDQSLCSSLEYSMNAKLLTEHHLEFLRLEGGCTGSYEATLVKIPHCWKSRARAHFASSVPELWGRWLVTRAREKRTTHSCYLCRLVSGLGYRLLSFVLPISILDSRFSQLSRIQGALGDNLNTFYIDEIL